MPEYKDHLDQLVSEAIFIIREAISDFKRPAVLWSTGKDSTVMLDLIRKAVPYGKPYFPVVHIDTGYKFPEIYKYRDEVAKKWDLPLKVISAKDKETFHPDKQGHFECCMALKTNVLKKAIQDNKWDCLIMSIRRDEEYMRNLEHVFSPRDKEFKWHFMRDKTEDEKKQSTTKDRDSDFVLQQENEFDKWGIYQSDFGENCSHVRVHPILYWTELDIWEYIKRENLPFNPLYLAKNGKRYRSLGCMPCTFPIKSDADTVDKIIEELKTTKESERAGRENTKESMMRKLRSMGYM